MAAVMQNRFTHQFIREVFFFKWIGYCIGAISQWFFPCGKHGSFFSCNGLQKKIYSLQLICFKNSASAFKMRVVPLFGPFLLLFNL